jgi:hypothetical protein
MKDIADDLAMRSMQILPVLRLSDSDAQLAYAGYAAESHEGQAIVRLGSAMADPDDEEAETQINRLHDQGGLSPDQCDLVIDLFEVRNERDVTRAEPVARKCVAWAIRRPWRSITVAAGAMPQSLTKLPTLRPTAPARP